MFVKWFHRSAKGLMLLEKFVMNATLDIVLIRQEFASKMSHLLLIPDVLNSRKEFVLSVHLGTTLKTGNVDLSLPHAANSTHKENNA